MTVPEEFDLDLVAEPDAPDVSAADWTELVHLLLHLQPARSVELDASRRIIHVRSYGQSAEIADALLAHVERLARTKLRVVLPGS